MRTARPKAYHRLVTDVHAEKQEVKLRWRSIVVRICGRSFIIQEMLGIHRRLDCLKRQWSLVEVEAIRMAMLPRDSHTIRDVILFPLPRSEKASNVEGKAEASYAKRMTPQSKNPDAASQTIGQEGILASTRHYLVRMPYCIIVVPAFVGPSHLA